MQSSLTSSSSSPSTSASNSSPKKKPSLKQFCYQTLWQQGWLSKSYKKTIYRKLCELGQAPSTPFSTSFYGLMYQGNLQNTIEFDIYYHGAFEKPLLFFLRDVLLIKTEFQDDRTKTVFCDIGSNIGQHSLFMSALVDQVHSFEPYPAVSRKLIKHIKLNSIENVTLHPVGLSDTTELLEYYAPTGRNQALGSFDKHTVRKGNISSGQLPLEHGDEYFRQQSIDGIDLIKVDVEGFEKRVIKGLQSTLESNRPVLVCEISYANPLSYSSKSELLSALPDNYKLFVFDTRKANGNKARRRGARAKLSGDYALIPLIDWRRDGQDNIVACPTELLSYLPRKNRPQQE